MSLRNKTLFTVGITIICLTAILYTVSINIWLNSIVQVEEQYTLKDVERALRAIEESLNSLEATASDWAAWDDTYEFVESGDDAYIESNLMDETFSSLRLNLMLIVDNDHQLVYGKAFDFQTLQESPLPAGVSRLLSDRAVVDKALIKSVTRGVFDLPDGPILMVSQPILDSEQSRPVRGYLVVGRYLDSLEIQRLEQLTRLSLSFFRIGDEPLPPELEKVFASLVGGNFIHVDPHENGQIVGHTILNDIHGKPVVMLSVENAREVYSQTRIWLNWLVVAFVISGIISGLAVSFQVERLVLSRISKINQEVNVVTTAGTPTARVTVSGADELAGLAENINLMLDSLEGSRASLYRTHNELESRTQQLANTNLDLQSEVAERVRIEEILKTKTLQQERLIETARQLTASLDVHQVLERIGAGAKDILESDGCTIYLLEKDGKTLTPVVAIEHPYDAEILATPIPVDGSFTGQVVKARRGLIFNEAGMDDTGYKIPGTPDEPEECIIAAPFVADDKVLGAMCVDRNARPYTEEELGLAETLAAYASSALKNAQAHDVLQKEVEERRSAEAALRDSEERYRTLVENVRIGVYRTTPGPRGQFLMANPAFLGMYGYDSEDELKQVAVADTYVDPNERKGFSDQLLTRGRVDGVELKLKRKDGSLLLGSVTAMVAYDDKGNPYFDCTIEDITRRKQADLLQTSLYQISQAPLIASSLEELFALVHQSVGELIPAANFYVALYDPATEIVSFPYFVDEYDPPPAARKMGRGLTEYLIRHGGPLLVSPEMFAELRDEGLVEDCGSASLDWLGVPLKTAEDKTIGALVVQTYHEGIRFDQNDQDLLTIVSTQVALAIERKRNEEALRESEARYRAVVEDQTELICRFDPQGRLTFVNDAYCRYFERDPSELIGENFTPMIPEEDRRLVTEKTMLISEQNPVVVYEHRVILPNGEIRWQQWNDRGIFDDSGRLVEYQSVGRDITERKYAEEQVAFNAFHDSLTSLPNRALFIDRLAHVIQHSKRSEKQSFAVLFLDLDRFKTVNDSLGHALGDQLLISSARRLLTCLRTSDTVARFGGDEFVILLEDVGDKEDVIQVSERILKDMAEPFMLAGHQMALTTSIGIVYGTQEYEKPEEVLRDADIAMYQAKDLGRNRYVVFNSAMRAQVVEHLKLETDLRQAIARGELELRYQPIYSFKTETITGFEALVRWQHATQGAISPTMFIYLAEETGLITPLGKWVLAQTCRQIRKWRDQFPLVPPLTVNINLSNKQFAQPDFYSQIVETLEETGLEPAALTLEITESALMENSDQAIAVLKKLRELGVKIHIDDFGTGYSSLVYLHIIPINAIKIDRSFISGSGAGGGEIVQTIVKLAKELKVETVAEGVETREQYDQLKMLDCDYVQGYYLSPSLNDQEAEALLRDTFK